MNSKTLINGIAYSFVDITVSIAGLPAVLPGFNGIPIKSISFNANQQKTANYENSKFATSYSYGKITYTGNLGLTKDSAEQLRDAIFDFGGGVIDRSIIACPALDISITFSNRGKVNTTTLKNVAFTTENFTGSEGNDTLAVSCDFICSFIDYGVKANIQTGIAVAVDAFGLDNQGIV